MKSFRCGIHVLLFILVVFFVPSTAEAKLYGVAISGFENAKNDTSVIFNCVSENELYGRNTSIGKWHFDQEIKSKGTTKEKFEYMVTNNMTLKSATKDDAFLFYFSGHSTEGDGISLQGHPSDDGRYVYYDEKYSFKDMAEMLNVFPGKIIVILDCCHAENFYLQGVQNLKPSDQNKFYSLLSCGSEEESHQGRYQVRETPKSTVENKVYGTFTKEIGLGLGYWNGNIAADKNSDGAVTFRELGDYVFRNIDFKNMTVKYYSYNNADIKFLNFPTHLSRSFMSLKASETYKLEAYYLLGDGQREPKSVTWTSSDSSIAMVDTKGKVTAKKDGTAVITARANGTSAQCVVKVVANSTSAGKTEAVTNLKATPYGKNKVLLTWKLSAGADGYIIYAQKNKQYAYAGMSFSHYFLDSKALDADYNYYWVFPFTYNADRSMNVGACSKYVYARGIIPALTGLKAKSGYSGVRVSWNARPASEGVDGYLLYGRTGLGPYHYIGMCIGRTSISYTDTKATYSQYNYYWVAPFHYAANKKVIAGIVSSKYVYGKKVTATIQLNKTSATLSIPDNSTLQLKVTVKGASQKVTWTSSNTSIATISSSGKVTAKKEGTVVITARANGVSAICSIIVRQKMFDAALYKKFLELEYIGIYDDTIYGKPYTSLFLDYFCVVDIDNDGTNELLIREKDEDATRFFTIKNGQVQYAGGSRHVTEKINKRYNGIIAFHSGAGYSGDYLLSIKNGKLYCKLDLPKWFSGRTDHYLLNDVEITKQQYDYYCKKYFENQNDIQMIRYLKNNSANRNKIQ